MKKFRKKVKQAHQLAHVIADRCDFIVAERIATAEFDFGERFADFSANFAIACIEARDQVEVSQIMCAFVYGATMTGLEFECSYESHREFHYVTVTLEKKNKKEVK